VLFGPLQSIVKEIGPEALETGSHTYVQLQYELSLILGNNFKNFWGIILKNSIRKVCKIEMKNYFQLASKKNCIKNKITCIQN
jgi:hypothetical protein